MNNRLIIFFALFVVRLSVLGQNNFVSNFFVKIDPERIVLNFDFDCELECEKGTRFRLRISFGNGEWEDRSTEAYSQIGDRIQPGKGKKIILEHRNQISNAESRQSCDSLVVSLLIENGPTVELKHMLEHINVEQVRSKVFSIVGNRYYKDTEGLKNLNATRKILSKSFGEKNFTLFRDTFNYRNRCTGQNYVAIKNGINDNRRVIIISAHYDTVYETPGADDNASGVAALLTLIECIASQEFNSSIMLVAFDMEEQGLVGSAHFINEYLQKKSMDVIGVINLDMIGYFNSKPGSQSLPDEFKESFPQASAKVIKNRHRGDFIVLTANENSLSVQHKFEETAVTFVPDLNLIAYAVPDNGEKYPESRNSDHATFWDNGYKAISIGDGGDTRNRNYHQKSDTVDKLNFEQMAKVVKSVLAYIGVVAEPTGYREFSTKAYVGIGH